eukprot:2862413-Heterocapsa_arctica.AAC.1
MESWKGAAHQAQAGRQSCQKLRRARGGQARPLRRRRGCADHGLRRSGSTARSSRRSPTAWPPSLGRQCGYDARDHRLLRARAELQG